MNLIEVAFGQLQGLFGAHLFDQVGVQINT
jgi:hypothetical protein